MKWCVTLLMANFGEYQEGFPPAQDNVLLISHLSWKAKLFLYLTIFKGKSHKLVHPQHITCFLLPKSDSFQVYMPTSFCITNKFN